MKRSIGFVTGARSDYGVVRPLLRILDRDPGVDLRLYVTGAHLSSRYGSTVREILKDGFRPAARVPIIGGEPDGPRAVTAALARGVNGFSRIFEKAPPDLLVLMSDRYEMLAAASAALIHRIPVAHLSGGKTTLGSMDESIRHAVTKMSHYHFTHNEANRRRLIRMGEQPSRVFAVGSPLLDEISESTRMSLADVRREAGIPALERYIVVLYHPETLSALPPVEQVRRVLGAVAGVPLQTVVVYPGADVGSPGVISELKTFSIRKGRFLVKNLPRPVFLAMLKHAAALVGNSSAGITDTPTLGVPAVNVGDRQKGMARAGNVIDAPCREREIRLALGCALASRRKVWRNPYGDGRAAPRILRKLKTLPIGPDAVKKPFYDA